MGCALSEVLSEELSYKIGRGEFTGLVPGMSNSQYHGLRGVYWSSSDFKYMYATSPAHFYAKYFSGQAPEKKVTDKMLLGSLVHCLFLTPQAFKEDFYVVPDLDRRTKVGKEAYEKAMIEAGSRQIVSNDMVDKAGAIVEAMRKKFYPWMSSYQAEVSGFWRCPFSQLWMRFRADALMQDTLIEVKTTDSAKPSDFERHCFNMNYDLSAAHYVEGLRQLGHEIKQVVFLVVETEPPYVCERFLFGESFMQVGHDKWLDSVTKLERGLKENSWPSYLPVDMEMATLMPPNWAIKRSDDGV